MARSRWVAVIKTANLISGAHRYALTAAAVGLPLVALYAFLGVSSAPILALAVLVCLP